MSALWRAAALVGVTAALAAAAGIGVRASYGARLTGDEPHYLLSAITLGEDGDLDISDEVAAGRFREFHEVDLDRQARPLAGGRLVEPHDPLLPALLALPARVGGWVAAKAVLALLNGVLAVLVLWTAVRRFGAGLGPSAVAAGLFGASAPLAVYGNQIYPELPASVAVIAAIGAVTGPMRRAGPVIAALAVVALPWLSVKYAPVAAVVAAVALVRLVRSSRLASAAVLTALLTAAAVAFLLAHQQWYGGWTAYATGDHFVSGEFGVVGFHPNYLGRSARLVGLLVDRHFGLAAWQPAWLLAVPALAALAGARPPGWAAVAGPLIAGWLTATFIALTMQGWWWPGRQVVVVVPAAVVAVAWWASTRRRAAVLAVTGIVGVGFYAWTVLEGLAGRITWVVDFFETGNPAYRAWRLVLPNYLAAGSARTWVLHALWAAGLAGLAAWGWTAASSQKDRRPPARAAD